MEFINEGKRYIKTLTFVCFDMQKKGNVTTYFALLVSNLEFPITKHCDVYLISFILTTELKYN